MNELTENQLAAMEIYAGWKDARGDFESEDPNELAEIASAGINTVIHLGGLVESLQQQLAAAREALQAAEADARRYLWLRDTANDIEADGPLVFMTGRNGHPVGQIWDSILYGESLDAAIDATLQRDRQP